MQTEGGQRTLRSTTRQQAPPPAPTRRPAPRQCLAVPTVGRNQMRHTTASESIALSDSPSPPPSVPDLPESEVQVTTTEQSEVDSLSETSAEVDLAETLAANSPSGVQAVLENVPVSEEEEDRSISLPGTVFTLRLPMGRDELDIDLGLRAYGEALGGIVTRIGQLDHVEHIGLAYEGESNYSMVWQGQDDEESLGYEPDNPQSLNTADPPATSTVAGPLPASSTASTTSHLPPVPPAAHPVAPPPTIPPTNSQVLADLDTRGTSHAAAIVALGTNHQPHRTRFYYMRRLVAILDDLGKQFYLTPGYHVRPQSYGLSPSGQQCFIVTEDLYVWARSKGVEIQSKTVTGHRTIWRRTDKLIQDLRLLVDSLNQVQQISVQTPQEVAQTAQKLGDARRLRELMEILGDGRDIDVTAPQYTTAEEIWRMKKEEWLRLFR